jgi:hypothetical protein
MTAGNPNPRLKARVELMIRVAAPLLDLVLAVGDRVSRVLERDDPDPRSARMAYQGEPAPRGLATSPGQIAGAHRSEAAPAGPASAIRG